MAIGMAIQMLKTKHGKHFTAKERLLTVHFNGGVFHLGVPATEHVKVVCSWKTYQGKWCPKLYKYIYIYIFMNKDLTDLTQAKNVDVK